MAAAGRADDPLQVVGSLPADLDDVPTLVAAGVTDFRFSRIPADPAEAEDLLADLVARFRAVDGRTGGARLNPAGVQTGTASRSRPANPAGSVTAGTCPDSISTIVGSPGRWDAIARWSSIGTGRSSVVAR